MSVGDQDSAAPSENQPDAHAPLHPEPAAEEPPGGDTDPAGDEQKQESVPAETEPADPESADPESEPPAGRETSGPQARSATAADQAAASELLDALTALAELGSRVDDIAAAAAELARLRARDTDLITRLHDDVTRLRGGEIAAALNPVVSGMIRLHDQMVSLGALSDPASPVGMLHTQLLQVLELTCAVRPFTPEAGERFDASRHAGARRVPAADAAADGTVASTVKVGFVRADGSIVRVAEVEVHRLSG